MIYQIKGDEMKKVFLISLLFSVFALTGCVSTEITALPNNPYDLANKYVKAISEENTEILSEILDEQIITDGATYTAEEVLEVYASYFALNYVDSLDLWNIDIEFCSLTQNINLVYSLNTTNNSGTEELKIKRVVLKTILVNNSLKIFGIKEEDLNTPDWLANEYNQSFITEDIGRLESILTDPIKMQGIEGTREAYLSTLSMLFGFSETDSIEIIEKQIDYNGDKTFTITMSRSVTSISNGVEVVNQDNTVLKTRIWNGNMRIYEIEAEPVS